MYAKIFRYHIINGTSLDTIASKEFFAPTANESGNI